MQIATTTEALMRMSVQVNGLWLPMNQAVRAVCRFCNPAIFHIESDVFDMGASGSSVFLRYRGKNFAICTLHQVRSATHIFPDEAFTLISPETKEKRIGLSPNEIITARFDNENHKNLSDLFIARFDDVRDSQNLVHNFIKIEMEKTIGSILPQQIKLIFSFGFPTEAGETKVDYDEDEIPLDVHLNFRWMKLFFHIAEPKDIDAPNRRPLILDSQHEYELNDPDGLSGAPVFFIYLDQTNQAHIEFAGIITHSNGYRFMLYESDKIRLCLDRLFQQPK